MNTCGQIIGLCWAVLLVYWIVAAFWAKRTAERYGWGGGQWGWLIVAGFLLLPRAALPLSVDRILWQYTPALGITADLVTLVGLAITLWARTTLGGNWSASVTIKEDHDLVAQGPYRYVRHPIYSGFILMVLGTVMLWGRVAGLLLWLACVLRFWLKLREEERVLARHFPEAYPRYRARVKALIPFVL
jgi:protein-S-isoprenylcysteine O-methyltransferase Ste14